MKQTGFIYSVQRYCIHDGPGIRTNIFFKGCQLHCPWCSNPESQHMEAELAFTAHKCTDCGVCLKKCPEGALQKETTQRIDKEKCNLCGTCVRYCPAECYQMFGREVTVEELVQEAEKDRPFYKNTGGGVTVTGGEPTLQHEFLKAFLRKCKERGMDTAMESHGYVEPEILKRLSPYIDHFLIDIKHMESRIHQEVTGVPNTRILENICMLTEELGKEVSLRLPCIPGFNIDTVNQEAVIDFAKQIQKTGNLKMLHLLPYHNLGMSKYEALGREYACRGVKVLAEEALQEYEARVLSAGIPVIIGG